MENTGYFRSYVNCSDLIRNSDHSLLINRLTRFCLSCMYTLVTSLKHKIIWDGTAANKEKLKK